MQKSIMQQVNRIAHPANDIHPGSREKAVEQTPFESRNHKAQYKKIEQHVVVPEVLGFVHVKLPKNTGCPENVCYIASFLEIPGTLQVPPRKHNPHQKVAEVRQYGAAQLIDSLLNEIPAQIDRSQKSKHHDENGVSQVFTKKQQSKKQRDQNIELGLRLQTPGYRIDGIRLSENKNVRIGQTSPKMGHQRRKRGMQNQCMYKQKHHQRNDKGRL